MTRRSIFGGPRLVQAMAASGIKNTAYAIAELIDNSIEAKADKIELLCGLRPDYNKKVEASRPDSIAIIDNGVGMSKKLLQDSLIMGQGTRFNSKGMGKFGMGLPNSSLSQCKRVEVYSWQKPGEVFMAHFDVDESGEDGLFVDEPVRAEIPLVWRKNSKLIEKSKSGTLVVWSKIHRLSWQKTNTLLLHCERHVGRIYRKFIAKNKIKIYLMCFDMETNQIIKNDSMKPNDPLYQLVPSNTPAPWNNKKMFQIDGEKLEDIVSVNNHDVIIRCTYAKKEARDIEGDAGRLPYGKHANSNLGVSVLRANRELYMDTNLCQTYDPLERWWGVEVEFPTELDDVIGLTQTKQDATHFSSCTHNIGKISRDEEGVDNSNEEYEVDDLTNLVEEIHKRIKHMRKIIKRQLKYKRTHGNDEDSTEEGEYKEDDSDGDETVTSKDEHMPREEKEKAITEALLLVHRDSDEASKIAKRILDTHIKTKIQIGAIGGYNFFDVAFRGGVTIITVNSEHPAYKHLIASLEDIPENMSNDGKERLNKVRAALNLIFVSWANFENHTVKDQERLKLTDVRYNWSKRLEYLMNRMYGSS